MFEKCISCERLGETCVPNLMLLPFPDLIQWIVKRQKFLGWKNDELDEKSKVPTGTFARIKGGKYADAKYSTIKNLLIALIGGTTDEFPCNEQVEKELKQAEKELKQLEALEKQATKLAAIEKENKAMKTRLNKIDELHRNDIRAIKEEYQKQRAEYQEQIAFLKDQLKAWQSRQH